MAVGRVSIAACKQIKRGLPTEAAPAFAKPASVGVGRSRRRERGECGGRMTERIKIIGNRQTTGGFEKAATFLDTVIVLRGDRPFIPKGYYRFKTFEEAQDWSIRMMSRSGRQKTDSRKTR